MYDSGPKFLAAECIQVKCFYKLKVINWKSTLLFHNSSCERYFCLILLLFQGTVQVQFLTLCL